MGGSDLGKSKRKPEVRLNMVLKGEHAQVILDLIDREVVSNNSEGIRLVLNKYLETINRPVLLVMVDGIKMEKDFV